MLNNLILETVNITKSFRIEKKALDNVSIKLKKGEILAIAGESGSGKTTLAKIITGLLDFDSGDVFVDGINLKKYSRYILAKKVQMIFQDPFSSLNPKLSVGTTIDEAIKTKNKNVDEVVANVLKLVGLPIDAGQKYPHQFSGGQRQRIAIARALACEPEIIIADEPVSSLDVSVQAQIMNLFLELKETIGLSYIIISHDLNLLNAVCENMVVMQDGKIVEHGAPEKIMNSPENQYTKKLIAAIPGRQVVGDRW